MFVIEILTNTTCPRRCPACNQDKFMKACPEYEYTEQDAVAFLTALERSSKAVTLAFSGGEPARWSKMDKVMSLFRAHPQVIGSWVVTSETSKESIRMFRQWFDGINISQRNDTASLIDSRPVYLRDATVYDLRSHSLFPKSPLYGNVNCCCASQGIRAAIIGSTVYPCIVAESLRLSGYWPDMNLHVRSLNDFFDYVHTLRPLGTYDACRFCVNNLNVRQICPQRPT